MSKYVTVTGRATGGSYTQTLTDHSEEIALLREAEALGAERGSIKGAIGVGLAADLLEMHDATSISLDRWVNARKFVENLVGAPILENHV